MCKAWYLMTSVIVFHLTLLLMISFLISAYCLFSLCRCAHPVVRGTSVPCPSHETRLMPSLPPRLLLTTAFNQHRVPRCCSLSVSSAWCSTVLTETIIQNGKHLTSSHLGNHWLEPVSWGLCRSQNEVLVLGLFISYESYTNVWFGSSWVDLSNSPFPWWCEMGILWQNWHKPAHFIFFEFELCFILLYRYYIFLSSIFVGS